MTEPISPQRLAETRQRADSLRRVGAVLSPSQSDRRNLLAEVDRLAARVADLEGRLAEARWTACYYRNAWRAQDELAEFSLGLLPHWVTEDGADNAPRPAASDRSDGSER